MNKEEIKSEIKEKEELIEALKKERDKLIDDLKKCPLSKSEQLENVLSYGNEGGWCMDYTQRGIVENYIADRNRHETIQVQSIIEHAFDSYVCDNFEDQYEMEKLFNFPFNEDNMIERYEKRKEYQYTRIVDKQLYIDLLEDIITEGVKSFEFDW